MAGRGGRRAIDRVDDNHGLGLAAHNQAHVFGEDREVPLFLEEIHCRLLGEPIDLQGRVAANCDSDALPRLRVAQL